MFVFRINTIFCYYCVVKERKGNLKNQQYKEETYIPNGFSAWVKTPKSFKTHRDSACHEVTTSYPFIISQCQDVGELMNNQQSKKRATERKYLLEVIRCLHYLGRQWIALQGHDGNDNFTQLHVFFYKHNAYKHIQPEIREKNKHMLSIFSSLENSCSRLLSCLKPHSKAYSEPCQTSKMKFLPKIVIGF